MHYKALSLLVAWLGCLLVGVPQLVIAANLQNWEGAHNDPAPGNRAIDWWYIQVMGKTPAQNGIPPSIEIVLKHGNTFQFGSSNTPLNLVEVHGFDTDGQSFAKTLVFNSSTVTPTPSGVTQGVWGNKEITFTAARDRKSFIMSFNTDFVKGAITLDSKSPAITGCGSQKPTDSPYFDKLVADGRPLTTAENILYKQTGWRITMFAADAEVDLAIGGKKVVFSGDGYKDSNWTPNAMNDFVKTWYVMIANVGPYAFVTFTGQPTTGNNLLNSGHLLDNGKLVSSQCNIVGERHNDISIIKPSGEVASGGVIAPTAFNLTFVLPSGQKLAFKANNIAENPSVSVYHRWVAGFTGGPVGGPTYTGFGITEWMNAGNVSHWIDF